MPISLITGPANAGKARLVMDSVRRAAARGHEPLLIVPTRADADYYLRELAGDGVAGGVRVERFAGLVREAVRRAGIAGPRLEGIARERVLHALAARNGVARPSAGYLRALGELFAELQTRSVGPGRFVSALASWAAADGEDPGRAGLGRIYSAYRATLERLGRPDAEQQAVAALDLLRERPALWGGSPVFFYGFDDLTPLQLDAIETLGRLVDAQVTVSLAYEPGRVAFAGRAGVFEDLRPLAGNVRELAPRAEHYAPRARPVLSHLERSLFEADASRLEAGETVRLLEGGGERAELELVAGEVARLIEDGMAAEQIAVLARPPLLGSELLREVFAAADVPIATRARPMFGDTPVGRGLIGLLRGLEPPGSAREGRAADLLAWLRTPGLLEQAALADRLEADLMRRGLTGAFEARALWEERHWPLERLERMQDAQAQGPLALLERVGVELGLLFAAPRRGRASVLSAGELEDAQALSEGRRALAELSGLGLLSRGDTLAAERHLFYAVLSRPEELLAVSWHIADDEAQPSSRSLFVEDLCDLFADGLMERRRRRALGAVEGPAAGPLLPAFRTGPVPLRDERLLAGLRERLWSASSLERWLGCPVKWYVESMLSPGELDPEAEPLAQGGLAHAALNDTLEGLRRVTGSARVDPATLPVALELLEQALELHEPARSLSVTPERRAAIARRLRSDLERYLTHAAQARGPLEPAYLELGFGFDEEDERGEGSALGPLDLGGGVRMRGRIDRVDLTPAGEAVLVDYKSGRVSAVKKWEEEGKLQLALYMLAVEQLLERPAVAGLYQPLSGKLQARGVIDADAELELEAVRTDVLEHEAVRELLDRAALTAREIAAQAGRGELEARPSSCAWGGGCSYPSICRCER